MGPATAPLVPPTPDESAAESSLEAKLLAVVPRLMRHLLAHARLRPAWEDMTYQQYNVMRIIASEAEVSQGEIARRLAVTPPVVTRLASALVEAGFAERREDPADRRAVLLSLTVRGKRRVARMRRDLLAAASELLEPLDAGEREAVAAAVDHLQPLLPERSARR
jgi:DNA-binding MarR family transcriptional regulator